MKSYHKSKIRILSNPTGKQVVVEPTPDHGGDLGGAGGDGDFEDWVLSGELPRVHHRDLARVAQHLVCREANRVPTAYKKQLA